MTDKKTPTIEQMADYRQMYYTAVLAADFDRIQAFESEYDVFTKVYEENGMMGVKGYIDFEGNFTQDEDEKFFNCSC